MASVTMTGNQWMALRHYPRGAAAGGSVVVDVTGGVLTVTKYTLPNGGGVAHEVHKAGASGEQQ